MSDTRIIKKYPNRRLYDTGRSRYITLEDVRELVLEGRPFKVVDSQSDEDITRNILLQIIVDQESGAEPLFSDEMLAQMIRSYGGAYQQMFGSYLQESLRLFLEQQQRLQRQLGDTFGTGTAMALIMELSRRNLELWADMQRQLLHMGRSSEDESGE